MINKVVLGYKFVSDGLRSKEGSQEWVLKKWYKHAGELELCKSGYHACLSPLDSLKYNYGNRWFIVEARGRIVEGDDKFVAREMRLTKEIPTKRVAVRFAVACARECLKNYEKAYPEDKRVLNAILAAEAWLLNPCDKTVAAARSAAESARSAAQSAESATVSAAWSAARSAWSAAWSAESATWSAESAAQSAAQSAESAAVSAAWSAEYAAWSAARSAESAARKLQERTLRKIIREEVMKK